MQIPNLWRRSTIQQMAATLAMLQSQPMSRMYLAQASADLHHLAQKARSFPHLLSLTHLYIVHNYPLSLLIGTQPFMGLELLVRRPLLSPRPETEHWVEELLCRNDLSDCAVLDIGTGTGCIALALASRFPTARVIGIDCNRMSIQLASLNANRLGISNVQFIQSKLSHYHPESTFDLVLANPPYIPNTRRLPRSVRLHESATALYSGVDGLQMCRQVIDRLPSLVIQGNSTRKNNLVLVLEIDSLQQGSSLMSEYSRHYRMSLQADQFGKTRTLSFYCL